jgi:hypothetical protein
VKQDYLDEEEVNEISIDCGTASDSDSDSDSGSIWLSLSLSFLLFGLLF